MPILNLNSARVDTKKVENGVWWKIYVTESGLIGGEVLKTEPIDEPSLLIRPRGLEWERAYEDSQRPYLLDIRNKKLSPEIERKIIAEAVAKSLWIGAKNISLGKEEFVWSEDRAVKMLADIQWVNLLDFIVWASNNRGALLKDEEEKAAGN